MDSNNKIDSRDNNDLENSNDEDWENNNNINNTDSWRRFLIRVFEYFTLH